MSTHIHSRTDASTLRVAIGILTAAVISIAVNTGIALGALALNPGGTRTGLDLPAYASLTGVGILAGTVGWAVIRRYATHAQAMLRILVPVVVVLSFIPDLGLLVSGAADAINVAGLLVMHVVVATVTVATVSRTLPLVDYRRAA